MSLNRAIVYAQHGPPSKVLRVLTHPRSTLPAGMVSLRFLLSAINPADINVVEGVYPSKPSFNERVSGFIGGNEGLAEVLEASESSHLRPGDWVVMMKGQLGTWTCFLDVHHSDVLKIPHGLSQVQGATMTVNPPTAYNMLHDYVKLEPGSWLVQNGANSAVGQAVIQIARARGLKTINFVRNRDDLDELKQSLVRLGADQVFTYDELEDKAFRKTVKDLTDGSDIRLGLNCVGGPDTTRMAQLLGTNAHLVSYGAMSKQPLSLPTSLFIFKNLTCHGFWQTRWYSERTRDEKEAIMAKLAELQLKEPEHEILTIGAKESDEQASDRVRNVFDKLGQGKYGKKVLVRFD